MVLGQVDYVIGLVMAASMIVGSYAGAHFAIKQGVGYKSIIYYYYCDFNFKNAFDYIQQFV